MQSAKDAAASVKEKAKILEAKPEEKAKKTAASTAEEKKMVEERRKVKEAEANEELHEVKARHAKEKLRHSHGTHVPGHNPPGAATYDPQMPNQYPPGAASYDAASDRPIGTPNPMAGATAPTYPLGGQAPPPPAGQRKYL